ncbi:hypothetical protein QT926_019735 [Xanthomonas campestris pv. campestris]|uniref:hypothetical protein n=1 Tax=Xanthomonas campestris TaxID=339 RepID=UPI0025A264C1|nr:hypothetical protein [Xanthomonas campestris]MDM7880653.1 hypothetical protein [Xanthomonas campestris pv. campestris]
MGVVAFRNTHKSCCGNANCHAIAIAIAVAVAIAIAIAAVVVAVAAVAVAVAVVTAALKLRSTVLSGTPWFDGNAPTLLILAACERCAAALLLSVSTHSTELNMRLPYLAFNASRTSLLALPRCDIALARGSRITFLPARHRRQDAPLSPPAAGGIGSSLGGVQSVGPAPCAGPTFLF